MKTRGYLDLAYALIGFAVLLTLAFGGGWSSSHNAKKGQISLRLAYFPNVTHAPALVGVSQGIFQQALPRYAIETKVVNAGPEAMEALLAGDVDFAYVGPSPAINTYLKSGGKALRIVSGACSGGASLVARGDLDIKSIRDLDGRSVAVPQLGGTQDVSCRHFLALNGLATKEEGGTVSVLPIKNPDILTLFRRKQIDAAWVPEPWASRLKQETGAHTVVDERTLWPNRSFTTTVLVVRTEFANLHPDAVAEFLKANQKSVAWLNSRPAEGRAAVNGALKELTGKALSKSVLDEAWRRLSFTTDPNPGNVLAMADAAFRLGYLKDRLPTTAGLFAESSTENRRPSVAAR